MWASVSSLTFSRARRGVPADIDISFEPSVHPPCSDSFGGPSGHFAHTQPPSSGRAEIHFNADKNWTPDNQDNVARQEAEILAAQYQYEKLGLCQGQRFITHDSSHAAFPVISTVTDFICFFHRRLL
ncbi:Matrix metalloproteinase-27 [Gryllus bimaculatus]|nr:Matrix metalloproteinase-27 [Gryllus bimaculatus]